MTDKRGQFRVGQGFDVHAFCPGDHVTLCGVQIPHSSGINAYSDGDVGIHALCDALLGAAGLGDIGQHFPPTEAQWKDADSRTFLRRVAAMLEAHGWQVGNADVTLICEAPRIGPHVLDMRTVLATELGATVDVISVKATTTEGLGFCGRGEGIAAMAVVSLAGASAR